jgi:hypothetical protein
MSLVPWITYPGHLIKQVNRLDLWAQQSKDINFEKIPLSNWFCCATERRSQNTDADANDICPTEKITRISTRTRVLVRPFAILGDPIEGRFAETVNQTSRRLAAFLLTSRIRLQRGRHLQLVRSFISLFALPSHVPEAGYRGHAVAVWGSSHATCMARGDKW